MANTSPGTPRPSAPADAQHYKPSMGTSCSQHDRNAATLLSPLWTFYHSRRFKSSAVSPIQRLVAFRGEKNAFFGATGGISSVDFTCFCAVLLAVPARRMGWRAGLRSAATPCSTAARCAGKGLRAGFAAPRCRAVKDRRTSGVWLGVPDSRPRQGNPDPHGRWSVPQSFRRRPGARPSRCGSPIGPAAPTSPVGPW